MSALASFDAGQLVNYRGRLGEIVTWERSRNIAVIDYVDGDDFFAGPASTLLDAFKKQDLHFVSSTVRSQLKLLPAEIEEMKRREAYAKALAKETHPNAKPVRERVAARVSEELGGDSKPHSISTIRRYYRDYVADGNTAAPQVLRSRHKKGGRSGYAEDVFREFMQSSNGALETPLASIGDLIADCRQWAEVMGHGALNTSDRQMRRYYKDFDRKGELRRALGRSEARKQLIQVLSGHTADYPMQQVQMDALKVSIGVLDDDGNYLGTAIVYNVLDVHTRCLLGYALSIGEKPGETTGGVVRAIQMAVMPKDQPEEYPMCGVLGTSVTDNGVAFTSPRAKYVIALVSTGSQLSRVKGAQDKGHVEAFNKTMRIKLFAKLPGYLGKRRLGEYSDRDLKKEARLTKRDLEGLLYEWVVEYHNTPHSGLEYMTPLAKWNEATKHRPPMLPDSLDVFKTLRGSKTTVTLQASKGFQIQNEFFNSKELGDLYHQLRGNAKKTKSIQVEVYFDEGDASGVTVVDPRTHEEFNVPNRDDIDTGTSFHERNVARKARKEANLSANGSTPSTNFNAKRALLNHRNKRRRKNAQETTSEAEFVGKTWNEIMMAGMSTSPTPSVRSASARAQLIKQQESVVEHLDGLADTVEPMNVLK